MLDSNVAAWLFLGDRGVLVWSLGQQALDITSTGGGHAKGSEVSYDCSLGVDAPTASTTPFVLDFNVAAWLFPGDRGVLVWSLGQQASDITSTGGRCAMGS